jgi:probable rRNA maturation factor
MILVDPDLGTDLDPDPATDALHSARAKSPMARSAPAQGQLHIPPARSLARFLAEAQTAVRLRGQVTVLLTSDVAIRKLNRQFRGKNKPTDVLSFPADPLVQSEQKGDLAISVPTARRQAVEQGHSLAIEIKVLILHGLLHLAGYDHETDQGQMARRERLLRRRLGLPLGLIERVTAKPAAKSALRARKR